MNSHAENLEIFEEAMKNIYGPYPQDPVLWQPPDYPDRGHRGRYLWADAFGVVNFITLSRENESTHSQNFYLGMAKQLVETVHSVLGRTSDGRSRLPGATDEEPLKGGLRVGMPDFIDIDSQNYHCLTFWMFALNRLSLATVQYGQERVAWKISEDMQHVIVIGHDWHLTDALGYFIYQLLPDTMNNFVEKGFPNDSPSLDTEIQQYHRIMASHAVDLPEGALELGLSLWIGHFDREAAWSRNLSEIGIRAVCNNFLQRNPSVTWGRSEFRDVLACLGIKCYLNDPEKPLQMGLEAMLDKWADAGPKYWTMFAAALIPGAFRKEFFDGSE
ncbi:hypothetical protein F5B19DRAFT_488559 [Rostrohypoxylon terebratum]|nr:hypothetical protein F5B19DRAFT_488559 [Rostrohypoxylon terebratum]